MRAGARSVSMSVMSIACISTFWRTFNRRRVMESRTRAFARLGDAASAIEFAARALALDSTDARSLWIKGTSLLSTGRADEALSALQACVRQDSTRIEYLQALAHAAELMDRVDVVAWAYG